MPGAGNNPRLDGTYRGPGKGYYSSTDNTLARGATGLPIPDTWDSGGVSIADASAPQDYSSGTNGDLSEVRIPGRSCQYSPLTGTCTPLSMMGLQAFTANVWVYWNGYRTVVHSSTLHRNPDNGIIGSPCWASTCNWSGWYLDIKGKLFNPQTDGPATGQLRFVRRGTLNGQNTTSELLAPAGQIPTGQWTMVTASYDGTTMKLYVNGQPVASATSSAQIQGAPAYVHIGGLPYSSLAVFGYLEGTADEATIWRRALTDAEVLSIYISGLPTPTTQPTILGELSSVGETATADPGGWDSTPTFAYQWYRCTTAGTCTLLPATGSSYVIQPGDAGHRLKVRVTATNAIASASADSLEWPTAPAVISVALETLAHRFRPILLFDEGEDWRPLNVETFLQETFNDGQTGTHHEVCPHLNVPGNCTDITDWHAIQAFRDGWGNTSNKAAWPYIDIHGDGDEITNYQSPHRQSCGAGDLMDCDTGSEYTSIYWHSLGPVPYSNYRYLDYWFFYRYNKFQIGDHEADWEGATIAVPADETDPDTFAFAALSAHGTQWHDLRETLACDAPSKDAISSGSCLSEGHRVDVFVADGSHANYPQECAPIDTGLPSCARTDASGADTWGLPEKDYGGEQPWGSNNDPDSLLRFPNALGWGALVGDPAWTDWWGWWGFSASAGDSHVESPGAYRETDVFYHPESAVECTERYSDSQTNCDGHEGPYARTVSEAAHRILPLCDAWAGPYVAVTVCDSDRLEGALRTGTVDQGSGIRLKGTSLRYRSLAIGNGVAQVVGTPLRPGETITVDGLRPSDRVEIRIRFATRKGVIEARLEDVSGPRVIWSSVRSGSMRFYSRDAQGPTRLIRPAALTVLGPNEIRLPDQG